MNIKRNGFTVIELLLAFAVLSFIVVAALGFFAQSFRFTSFNEDKLTAVHLSSYVLETVQESFEETSCPPVQTNLFSSYIPLFDDTLADGSFSINDHRFYISLFLYCEQGEGLQTLHVQVFDSAQRKKLLSENFGYVNLEVTP